MDENEGPAWIPPSTAIYPFPPNPMAQLSVSVMPPPPPKLHAKFPISSFFCAKDSSSFRETSRSVPRLNSAAHQESLTPRRTPSGDRKGLLCGISLSAGDQGAAFDYMSVTVGSGGGDTSNDFREARILELRSVSLNQELDVLP